MLCSTFAWKRREGNGVDLSSNVESVAVLAKLAKHRRLVEQAICDTEASVEVVPVASVPRGRTAALVRNVPDG